MNRRPSRFVIALARWALMAGLAGIVLALLALIDRWRAPENLEARHNLLLISAVMLAAAFVLAPFVRRAFGVVVTRAAARNSRKTLLDEMRERPEGEQTESSAVATVDSDSARKSTLSRIVVSLYVVFGVVLTAVLIVMG